MAISQQPLHEQGTFSSVESFSSFVRAWPWQWQRRLGGETLSLSLPDIDPGLQAKLAKRLSHYMSCCGCQLGSFFVIGAMIWRIPLFVELSQKTFSQLCLLIGIIIGAGIIGKMIGLAVAKSLFYFEAYRLILMASRVPGASTEATL